jgi:uncharacterized protein YdeI (YjbR/CyaY-like superfamily)
MPAHDELEILAFASAADFEAWLDAEHARSPGLMLKIAKKATGIPTVTHPEALDVAICFGWIDGIRRALDDVWFLQRFSPRRPRSRWSQINRDKATALIEAGRLRPAGLLEVERAKGDGRWDAAYAGHRAATVPDDLQRALEAEPAAAAAFATLDSRNRYAILYRVGDAKRADTRARRIATFVAMLARGERLWP